MDGCYEFEGGNKAADTFNLRPRQNLTTPIPDEQRAIHATVYETLDTLRLLQAVGAFKKNEAMYEEFGKRVLEAAEVGCVGAGVDPKQAERALDQIRAAIVRRRGRGLIYRYLLVLAGLGAIGAAFGLAWYALGMIFPALIAAPNFGLVLVGSMAGAWISVAASRLEISFGDIQDFLDTELEPAIRMGLVGLIALAAAVFIQLRVFSFALGNFDFAQFLSDGNAALLVGLVAGISEKALSVDVIQRAKKVF